MRAGLSRPKPATDLHGNGQQGCASNDIATDGSVELADRVYALGRRPAGAASLESGPAVRRKKGGLDMLITRFTELVGCSVPIQLAGFAPPLLAAR